MVWQTLLHQRKTLEHIQII